MKSIEDFEPFVAAYATFIPSEIIQHSIRETIVEFMRETKIARDTTEIETQEKVHDYILDIDECRRIVKVQRVEISPQHCSGREHWSHLRQGDDADYTIELRRGDHPIIIFRDEYKKPHKVRIEYSWALGRDTCDIPDFIYEDFMDAIVAGTLGRLAMLPDAAHLAPAYQMMMHKWTAAIQEAKIEKSGGRAKKIVGGSFISSRRRGSVWR